MARTEDAGILHSVQNDGMGGLPVDADTSLPTRDHLRLTTTAQQTHQVKRPVEVPLLSCRNQRPPKLLDKRFSFLLDPHTCIGHNELDPVPPFCLGLIERLVRRVDQRLKVISRS